MPGPVVVAISAFRSIGIDAAGQGCGDRGCLRGSGAPDHVHQTETGASLFALTARKPRRNASVGA